MACDPLGKLQDGAFEEVFPKGNFPVTLCVAELPNHLRVSAYAMVEFLPEQPTTWELAHLRSLHSATGYKHAFWVDSGTACFMDLETLALLKDYLLVSSAADAHRLQLIQQVFGDQNQVGGAGIGRAVLAFAQASGLTCVVFPTGWGDDLYSSYLGRTVSGAICRLLTEFNVLDIEPKD